MSSAYYTRLDTAVCNSSPFLLDKSLDHDNERVLDLFKTLNEYIADDPLALRLDPFVTRAALLGMRLFALIQGEVMDILRVRDLVYPWRISLDVTHPDAENFGGDIPFPPERFHVAQPINGYAVPFPRLTPVLDRGSAALASPFVPPAPSPTRTTDASSLTSSQAAFFDDPVEEPAPVRSRGGVRGRPRGKGSIGGRGRGSARGGARGSTRGGSRGGALVSATKETSPPPASPPPGPTSAYLRTTVYVQVPPAPYSIPRANTPPLVDTEGEEDEAIQQLLLDIDDQDPTWVDVPDLPDAPRSIRAESPESEVSIPLALTTNINSKRTTRPMPASRSAARSLAPGRKKKPTELPTRPIILPGHSSEFTPKFIEKRNAFLKAYDFSAFGTTEKVPGHLTSEDLKRNDSLDIIFVCGRCAGISSKGYTVCRFQGFGFPCTQCQTARSRKCTFEYTRPDMQEYLTLQHEPVMAADVDSFISKVNMAHQYDQQLSHAAAQYKMLERLSLGAWLDVQISGRRLGNSFPPGFYAPFFDSHDTFDQLVRTDPEAILEAMAATLDTPDPSELYPDGPGCIFTGLPSRLGPAVIPEFIAGSSRGAGSATA